MELGKMEMKSNYGTTHAYVPQLMDLYKQKHGLTFNEAYTPSPAKPFRNPPGFNKQGTGVGNKLAQQNRAELNQWRMGMSMAGEKEPTQSKGTPVPAKEFAQGVLKDLKKVNVKEAEGSWIAYDPETKQIKKRFKTHTAGKSYAQTHGLGFASSEYYFDRVKEPVNELDVNTLKSYADKRGAQVAAMKADNPNPQTGSKEWVQQAVPAQQVGLANRKIARKERQQGVAEDANDSPVAGAITRRILMQRHDLLKQYGPELVGAAVDNVADYVGDVEEIGSSDVSAWVAQVERMLKDNPPEAFAEGQLDEIDRRGFLKGLGAAALAAVVPTVAKGQTIGGGEEEAKDAATKAGNLFLNLSKGAHREVAQWVSNTVYSRVLQYYNFGGQQINVVTDVAIKAAYQAVNGDFQMVYQAADKDKEDTSLAGTYLRNRLGNRFGVDAGGRDSQLKMAGSLERFNLAPIAEKFVKEYTRALQEALTYFKQQTKESVQQGVAEGKGLAKKVKIVKGPDAGKTGWIREVKHGAFKGAPKTYYIDLDDGGQANNLPATALRLVKEQGMAEDGEGTPEGLPHLTKELLSHIVDQVGTEGAHAIIKSLEWGDGAAEELLTLILKDLRSDLSDEEIAEHIGQVKGGYRLYSHKGKNLGTFDSKAGAEKHEREVQYFKHAGESVEEAQTDYSKRRQRERDVDAGKPVSRQPKNPQTDYARKRAQQKKEMELGEMDKSQKGPAGWNIDDYDYSKGKWTQGKIVKTKDAVKDMSKELNKAFNSPKPNAKKHVKESYWTKLQNERNTKVTKLVDELKENIK